MCFKLQPGMVECSIPPCQVKIEGKINSKKEKETKQKERKKNSDLNFRSPISPDIAFIYVTTKDILLSKVLNDLPQIQEKAANPPKEIRKQVSCTPTTR